MRPYNSQIPVNSLLERIKVQKLNYTEVPRLYELAMNDVNKLHDILLPNDVPNPIIYSDAFTSALTEVLPLSAGQYANSSALYELANDSAGQKLLRNLCKRVGFLEKCVTSPKFIDALCAIRGPEAGVEYSNTSALYWLTIEKKSISIDNYESTALPLLFENQKFLGICASSPKFFDALCVKEPSGNSALCSLLCPVNNLPTLELLFNNQEFFYRCVTWPRFINVLCPEEGSYSVLASLFTCSEGENMLAKLFDVPQLVENAARSATFLAILAELLRGDYIHERTKSKVEEFCQQHNFFTKAYQFQTRYDSLNHPSYRMQSVQTMLSPKPKQGVLQPSQRIDPTNPKLPLNNLPTRGIASFSDMPSSSSRHIASFSDMPMPSSSSHRHNPAALCKRNRLDNYTGQFEPKDKRRKES